MPVIDKNNKPKGKKIELAFGKKNEKLIAFNYAIIKDFRFHHVDKNKINKDIKGSDEYYLKLLANKLSFKIDKDLLYKTRKIDAFESKYNDKDIYLNFYLNHKYDDEIFNDETEVIEAQEDLLEDIFFDNEEIFDKIILTDDTNTEEYILLPKNYKMDVKEEDKEIEITFSLESKGE